MSNTSKFIAVATFSLLISCAMQSATAQRLKLYIQQPIAYTDGSQCALPLTQAAAAIAQPSASDLLLTEHDVVAWNPTRAIWSLMPERVSDRWLLVDHCFTLSIDDKVVVSGIVLSAETARLTGLPTLNVLTRSNSDKPLDIQLTSGNHGAMTRLIFVDTLDAIIRPEKSLTTEEK